MSFAYRKMSRIHNCRILNTRVVGFVREQYYSRLREYEYMKIYLRDEDNVSYRARRKIPINSECTRASTFKSDFGEPIYSSPLTPLWRYATRIPLKNDQTDIKRARYLLHSLHASDLSHVLFVVCLNVT